MNTETTLVIFKPEVLENRIMNAVLKFFEEANLVPEQMYITTPTKARMADHYSDLTGRYSDELISQIIDRMTRGPCVILAYRGEGVIVKIRKIIGATDPKKADLASIRGTLATDINYNLVHASDSPENAKRELDIWFPAN